VVEAVVEAVLDRSQAPQKRWYLGLGCLDCKLQHQLGIEFIAAGTATAIGDALLGSLRLPKNPLGCPNMMLTERLEFGAYLGFAFEMLGKNGNI